MKSKVLLFSLLFIIVISQQINAQCSVTTTPTINASALTCGTAPLNLCSGILYIGDGINPTTVIMNGPLDLTCLGAIQLIVRNNGAFDFSSGNDYLTLGVGSSIIFQAGANLIGGSCNASERIYIGADLIASCNGNGPGADYSFAQLLALGGYNIVKASFSPTAACGSGIFTLTADPVPGAGATIKWYTVPSGGLPFSNANPYITPTIATTSIYYVEAFYSSSGVTTPRISVTATVNPLPSTPAIGATTQPTCVLGTGSVVLNGLPAVGTWTLTRTGTSGAITTGTGTSTTVSGLAAGTYTFTVSNGTCTSLSSGNVVITAPVQAVWNGVSWSVLPTLSTSLVFNGNYSSIENLDGCNCKVNIGNVVFNAGHTLNLIDAVTVAGGALTFNNTASLLQANNTPNSGNITYIRNTTPVINLDYTFWSSPTSGFQTLLNFSPNTSTGRFFTYHNIWQYTNPSSDVFAKGIGYAIWSPQGTSASLPTVLPHQFIGVPNNGDVNITVSLAAQPISNRLLGNPYPSTLDADAFINANIVGTGTINQTISGTLYFWTHNHTLSGNNYLSSDYATYNLFGGTAVSTGTGNTTAPTRYIAAGQGFFVNTLANGIASFRNNMRMGSNNTNFYKNSNSENLEKHRIWLNLTDDNSNFSQTMVGYGERATNGYDSGYDGLYFGTNQFVMYSLLNNDSYAIQARALPFSNLDEIPIGFITNTSGNLSIGIDHLDGLFLDGQKIYLEDKLLKTINDITHAPYQFTATQGIINNRFVLRYTDQTLSNASFDLIENGVSIFGSNNEIKINSSLENIKDYTVYNVLGQILASKNNVNTNQSAVSSIIKNNQTLVVKVILANSQMVIKKIIF